MTHDVGEEHRIEFGGFELFGQIDPGVDVCKFGLLCVLAASLSVVDVAGGVHDECVEVQRGVVA